VTGSGRRRPGGRGGRFHAYGLDFASTIPIPEMRVVEEGPQVAVRADVTIELGPVPDHLPDPSTVGVIYEPNATELLVRIADVGRYWISDGRRIVIDPAPEATDHEVRVFLLGTCIGALLHQRGFFVFHASGIGTPDGAVLFTGVSGAGKSTLLAELLRRGSPHDGRRRLRDRGRRATARPEVIPSYPRTRLWGETAARLSIETTGLTRTRPTMDKYERQLPDQFWDEVAPLRRIYHLAGSNGDELSLTPLGSLESFQVVRTNTYRDRLIDGFALRREHFELASAIAASVEVVRVVRPVDSFRLVELADLILEDLDSR
jgi:hypothetical protein